MKLNAAIPTSPLVFPDGNIRPEWRSFFNSLWIRTGGAVGISSDTTVLEAELAAETEARKQEDSQLGQAIAQEATAREQGDATLEAELRGAISSSTQGWQVADASLVPKSQLCSLWGQCSLTFLPTSDPGHGMPWLNSGVVTVGTPAAATVGIGLEDASGDWELADGTGHILYG